MIHAATKGFKTEYLMELFQEMVITQGILTKSKY